MQCVTNKRKISPGWLIALCWTVYVCSYIGKLGYSANIILIEDLYQVTHSQSGIVGTCFFIAYGCGQVINGIFSRRYRLPLMVFLSLMVSSVCNLLVAIAPSFSVLKYIWLVNGFSLSFLWPLLVRLLSEQLENRDMSKAVVVMGTSVAVGTFLVYGLSALFVRFASFKLIFYTAAVLLPIIAIIWLVFCPKQTVDLKSVTEQPVREKEKKSRLVFGLIGAIGILAVFAIITNLVKDGLVTWVPSIMKDLYNLDDSLSILLTLGLPICSIFGTAVAVKLNKRITDPILLCGVLFLLSALLTGGILSSSHVGVILVLILFSVVSCLMSGVNNVITSMVPLYWKEKVNSGLLAGLLNGFCYIGSALSSVVFGISADLFGWGIVFLMILGLCIFSTVIGTVFHFAIGKNQ